MTKAQKSSSLAVFENELKPYAGHTSPTLFVNVLAALAGKTPAATRLRLSAINTRNLLEQGKLLYVVGGDDLVGGDVFGKHMPGEEKKMPGMEVAWQLPNASLSPVLQLPGIDDPSVLVLHQSDEIPPPVEGYLDLVLDESVQQTRFMSERTARYYVNQEALAEGLPRIEAPKLKAAIRNAMKRALPVELAEPVSLPRGGVLPGRMPELLDTINSLSVAAARLIGDEDVANGVIRGPKDLPREVALLLRRAGAVQGGMEVARSDMNFFDLLRLMLDHHNTNELTTQQMLETLASDAFRNKAEAKANAGEIDPLPRRQWAYQHVYRPLNALACYGYVRRSGGRDEYRWSVPSVFLDLKRCDALELIAANGSDRH